MENVFINEVRRLILEYIDYSKIEIVFNVGNKVCDFENCSNHTDYNMLVDEQFCLCNFYCPECSEKHGNEFWCDDFWNHVKQSNKNCFCVCPECPKPSFVYWCPKYERYIEENNMCIHEYKTKTVSLIIDFAEVINHMKIKNKSKIKFEKYKNDMKNEKPKLKVKDIQVMWRNRTDEIETMYNQKLRDMASKNYDKFDRYDIKKLLEKHCDINEIHNVKFKFPNRKYFNDELQDLSDFLKENKSRFLETV